MTHRPARALALVLAAAVPLGAPTRAPAAEPAMSVKDYVVPVYTPTLYRTFYATGISARDVGYVGVGRGVARTSGRWTWELAGRAGVSHRPELDFGSLQLGLSAGPSVRILSTPGSGGLPVTWAVYARVNGDLATNVWGADGSSHRADVTAGTRLWTRLGPVGLTAEAGVALPVDFPDEGDRALRFGFTASSKLPGDAQGKSERLLAGVYWLERFDGQDPRGDAHGLVQVWVAILR